MRMPHVLTCCALLLTSVMPTHTAWAGPLVSQTAAEAKQFASEDETMAQGLRHFDARRYQEAEVCFRRVIELNPNRAAAWSSLGATLVELPDGDLEEAGRAYDRAIALAPTRVDAHQGRGVVYRKLGDYESAVACYEAALAIDPDDGLTLSSLGVTQMWLGDYPAAYEACVRATELEPAIGRLWANAAAAAHYVEAYEERDAFYERAEELGYPNTANLQRIFAGELVLGPGPDQNHSEP